MFFSYCSNRSFVVFIVNSKLTKIEHIIWCKTPVTLISQEKVNKYMYKVFVKGWASVNISVSTVDLILLTLQAL